MKVFFMRRVGECEAEEMAQKWEIPSVRLEVEAICYNSMI